MIVIIDNYDSFIYNLYQVIAAYYSDVRVCRNDKITLSQLKGLSLEEIILSPGLDRPENAGIWIEIIKQLLPRIPLLGVCLGHQAIAAAFGGKIIQTNKIVHGKATSTFHYQDTIFSNISSPFEAGRYHSLMIDKNFTFCFIHYRRERR